MVGIRSFPIGEAYFQGRTVSFREANVVMCSFHPPFFFPMVPVEVSIYVVSDPYTTFCFLAFIPAMAERSKCRPRRLSMEFHDQKHCQNHLNIENIRRLVFSSNCWRCAKTKKEEGVRNAEKEWQGLKTVG